MSGESKGYSILVVAIFIGVLGSRIVGWPALVCAAVAISAIALSKGE